LGRGDGGYGGYGGVACSRPGQEPMPPAGKAPQPHKQVPAACASAVAALSPLLDFRDFNSPPIATEVFTVLGCY